MKQNIILSILTLCLVGLVFTGYKETSRKVETRNFCECMYNCKNGNVAYLAINGKIIFDKRSDDRKYWSETIVFTKRKW